MRFDPTPDGVTLFRVNAVGFAVSLLAMFAAIYWWMIQAAPELSGEPFFLGFFGGVGLVTASLYLLPALVPRRSWGYIVGWIQIALLVTSGTATLPTLPVLIAWARGETRDWFDRRPIDERANNPRTLRAKVIALVGYYTVISAIPFAIAAWVPAMVQADTHEITDAVATKNVQVEVRGNDVSQKRLAGAEQIEAKHLITDQRWTLAEQDGPVAVTVWASYCGSCTRQMRAIAQSGSPGLQTTHVTMALDCEESPGAVRHKLASSNIESTALCHTNGLDVDVLPTTVFFDANGQRRATLVGHHPAQTIDDVAKTVEKL